MELKVGKEMLPQWLRLLMRYLYIDTLLGEDCCLNLSFKTKFNRYYLSNYWHEVGRWGKGLYCKRRRKTMHWFLSALRSRGIQGLILSGGLHGLSSLTTYQKKKKCMRCILCNLRNLSISHWTLIINKGCEKKTNLMRQRRIWGESGLCISAITFTVP